MHHALYMLSLSGFIPGNRYFRISRLIEGAQQAIEVHPTAEGVKKLQNLIDERRSINVLEFGYFHKKLANKLSGLYKNISL